MILLADLSNLSFSVALYSRDRKKICSYKTYADKTKSKEEYIDILQLFFTYKNIDVEEIEGAILASVVPSLTKRIQNAISEAIQKRCLLLNRKLKTGIAIRMDNPSEVGSDLIAAAVGAYNDYATSCLIVNLSTVASFTIVTDKKEFIGGALFPGLRVSAEKMWSDSAQLMDIDLDIPNRLIGRSTKESMNAGIVGGYITLIEAFCQRMEEEFQRPLKKIITGPDSKIVINSLFGQFEFNENLVFDGLYDIYIKNNL